VNNGGKDESTFYNLVLNSHCLWHLFVIAFIDDNRARLETLPISGDPHSDADSYTNTESVAGHYAHTGA
jgi:hypothetical protein